jgi:hypothetical protein
MVLEGLICLRGLHHSFIALNIIFTSDRTEPGELVPIANGAYGALF